MTGSATIKGTWVNRVKLILGTLLVAGVLAGLGCSTTAPPAVVEKAEVKEAPTDTMGVATETPTSATVLPEPPALERFVEYGKLANGTALLTLGLYDDEYVREDGEWCFRSRRFRPLYSGPPDLSAQPIPLGD